MIHNYLLKLRLDQRFLCAPCPPAVWLHSQLFLLPFQSVWNASGKAYHQIVLDQGNHLPYDHNFWGLPPLLSYKASNLSFLPSITLLIPNSTALARVAG